VSFQDRRQDHGGPAEAGIAVNQDPVAGREAVHDIPEQPAERRRLARHTEVGNREALHLDALAGKRLEEPGRAAWDLPVLDETQHEVDPGLPPGEHTCLHRLSLGRLVRIAGATGAPQPRLGRQHGVEDLERMPDRRRHDALHYSRRMPGHAPRRPVVDPGLSGLAAYAIRWSGARTAVMR
jgi:hypothetical protein